MRPNRAQMFMEIAHVISRRSTCCRLNVGAVLVHNRRIISHGYNGVPQGQPHCQGNDCPGKEGPCGLAIHAEVNALHYMGSEYRNVAKDLYVTHSPCEECLKLIYKYNVETIWFSIPYRNIDHLKGTAGILQVLPSGWIVDYSTGKVHEEEP